MKKLISTDVSKAQGPVSGFFSGLANSIKGIGTGILFIIISFFVLSMAVNQVNHSDLIKELPLQSPEDVMGNSGMVKIHDVPNFESPLSIEETGTQVLYYEYTLEDYAVRKTTETETSTDSNGNKVTNTYEVYEPAWEVDRDSSFTKWADFDLGGIEVDPSGAKLALDTTEFYTETFELEYPTWKSEEELLEVPQKERVTIKGISFDDEVIVVGYLEGDQISTGNEDGTYFISNKTEQQFVQDQENSEAWAWKIKVFATWLLMTLGFTMLFGPITHILGIVPGLGKLLDTLLFIIFGIVSAVIVFFAYVGMKFWWLIGIGLIALIGFFVYRKVKKGDVVEVKKNEKKKKE